MTSSGSYLIWTAKPLFEGPGTYRQHADSDDSKESGALQLLEPQLPNLTTRASILAEDAMVTHTLSLSGIRPEPLCSISSPSSFSSPFIPNSAPTSMSRDAQSLPTVAPDINILLSPTSRLPDELLGEIFHEYVLSFSWGAASNSQIDPSKRQFAPLSLMRICSRWRDVCISTPKLWVYHYIPMLKPGQQLSRFTSLKLGGEGNMDRSSKSKPSRDLLKSYINLTQYTKLALTNSKSCPLHVHIVMSPAIYPVPAAVDLLFSTSQRWKSAYIACTIEATSPVTLFPNNLGGGNNSKINYADLEELTLEYDVSGLNEEQFNHGLGFVGNGHGLRIPSFVRAPKLHALRLVKMKWWPVLDSELDISIQDDDAIGETDDGDDGEGFERNDGEGRHEMEEGVVPHYLPYSQIRSLTGSASLPTLYTLLKLCTNLERVEVEQERFPGLTLPPPDVSDSDPNGGGGRGDIGEGGRGLASGVASPHTSTQQVYSPIYDWNSTFHTGHAPNTKINTPCLHTLHLTLPTDQPSLTNWIRRAPSLRSLSLTGGKLTSKIIHAQVVRDLIAFVRRHRESGFFDSGFGRFDDGFGGPRRCDFDNFTPSAHAESCTSGLESFALSTVEISPDQLVELFTLMHGLKKLNLVHSRGLRGHIWRC
ncbi:uncharacterized protein C8R40DRAFT_87981 [Lentinula edodes]|uniref:uncharacterized protein n=1 Tax=Lentinula edodes TaxID=5353 RepID=UPI001E8E3688|nr:uncharacterized protein C8R40DRAFT_87981 [Lentinula edodes]KAH7877026.1 hypothetical protein C8R40DRAFT_87981 [Lentinula edodes]